MRQLGYIFLCVFIHAVMNAQPAIDYKRDWSWVLGKGCSLPYYGVMKCDFSSSVPTVDTNICTDAIISEATTTMSDTAGKMIFYTNGLLIVDSTFHLMDGCSEYLGYGGGPIDLSVPGAQTCQGVLALPDPSGGNQYFLFHTREAITPPPSSYYCPSIYYTQIDLNGNNGLGQVIDLNHEIAQDLFELGQFTACRHANGRDWWIVFPTFRDTRYYIYLLDPSGLHLQQIQDIGNFTAPTSYIGQSVFTPDGSKYVRHCGYYTNEPSVLQVFNFDRCTGMLSDHIEYFINSGTLFVEGLAVSPNSRYAYATADNYVYQLDLQAPDIGASLDTVAVYDGYLDPDSGIGQTRFYLAQLAPNNKIYISYITTARSLHVIDNPNLPGDSCNILQHGFSFPYRHGFGLPNIPNFRLGPVDGSSCDTLGINSVVYDYPEIVVHETRHELMISPNPAVSSVEVGFGATLREGGVITLVDMRGQVIQRHSVQRHALAFGLDLSDLPEGIYIVSVYDRKTGSVRSGQVYKVSE